MFKIVIFNKMLIKFVVMLLSVSVGNMFCDVVRYRPCPGDKGACSIHEVRIDPCEETPRPCAVVKGKYAEISFDFTPTFSASKLRSMVYWANGLVDLPFHSMDPDGCHHSTCPLVAGDRHSYKYSLEISRKLPTGVYPIKWMTWNENDHGQECCFMTTIELRP